MAALIARNQSRTSIQSIIEFVDSEHFLERDYTQIFIRWQYLVDQWLVFVDASNQLRVEAIDAEDEQEHADIFTRLELLFLEARSTLEFRMHQLEPEPNQPQQEQEIPPRAQQQPIIVQVNQQTRDIENTWGEFNGNFTKWRTFCDLFTDRVHNNDSIAPAHKFRLLKKSLTGNAALALGERELSDNSYIEAWNRLKELYEQIYLTGCKLVQRLVSVQKLERATGFGIQKLSNIGNDVFRQLRALGFPVEHAGFMFVFILHDRLDPETSIKWNLERNTEFPALLDFLSFLDKQARALVTLQHYEGKNASGSQDNKKRGTVADRANYNPKRPKGDVTESKKPEGLTCPVCNEAHNTYKCPTFTKLSLTARKQMVKAKNLCHNCLKLGHLSKDCFSKECFRCNVKHNSLLCNENSQNKVVASVRTRSAKTTKKAASKRAAEKVEEEPKNDN